MKSRVFVAAAALLVLSASIASAELIITAEDVVMPFSAEDQEGSLEVYVQSDEDSAPEVIGHQVRLNLSPADAGVEFVDGGAPTEHDSIFPTAPPNVTVQPGGTTVDAGQILFTGAETLNDGDGLFKVNFLVAGGTGPGVFDVAVSDAPGITTLLDPAGSPMDFSTRDGQIEIVPEPSTVLLALLGALGLCVYCRRRRA